MKTEIVPSRDRFIVTPVDTVNEGRAEALSGTGFQFKDDSKQVPSGVGIVVAVGEDVKLEVDSRVIYSKFSFDEIEYEGVVYHVVSDKNLLAVVKQNHG